MKKHSLKIGLVIALLIGISIAALGGDTIGRVTGRRDAVKLGDTTYTRPIVYVAPMALAVRDGAVRGGWTMNQKFGYRSAIPDTAEYTIWTASGNPEFSNAGASAHIVSSQAAGVGIVVLAQVARRDSETGIWTFAQEEYTLNGTTPVVLGDDDVLWINRIQVLYATTAAPVGDITASHVVSGGVLAHIVAGENQTQQLVGVVPHGRRLNLQSLFLHITDSSVSTATIRVRCTDYKNVPAGKVAVRRTLMRFPMANDAIFVHTPSMVEVNGPAFVEVTIQMTGTPGSPRVGGMADYFLRDQ